MLAFVDYIPAKRLFERAHIATEVGNHRGVQSFGYARLCVSSMLDNDCYGPCCLSRRTINNYPTAFKAHQDHPYPR